MLQDSQIHHYWDVRGRWNLSKPDLIDGQTVRFADELRNVCQL